MKKIILAFDGIHFSEGAFEFARKLNELQPILLTGVFFPQAEYANLWSYTEAMGVAFVPLIIPDESEQVQKNIERFEKLCIANSIDYRVHQDFFDFALPELKKESCYADLLILGSELFYKNISIVLPNDYLEETLHNMACPVILVPEKFDFPERIILAYDGSEDAVFAIKQFAYLFPELTHQDTLLVYAHEDETRDFPEKLQMEELVTRHFQNLSLHRLGLNPKKYFAGWLLEKKSAILVSGAYGKFGLSRLFKRSFLKDVLAAHRLPVFIAHR